MSSSASSVPPALCLGPTACLRRDGPEGRGEAVAPLAVMVLQAGQRCIHGLSMSRG